MANTVIMPKLGATMDEGRIIRWFAGEGDNIKKGAPLFEVESDKATLEVESPYEGTLLKILHFDGDIPVLQPIGIIGTPGENILEVDGREDVETKLAVPAESDGTRLPQTAMPDIKERKCDIRSTPAAKHLAKMNNIDLAEMKPGENGIITGNEVKVYLKAVAVRATPLAARIAQMNNIPLDTVEHEGKKVCKADVISHMDAQPVSRIQKMGNIRRKTAERMTATWQNVPMAANAVEVDASFALDLCDTVNKKISDGSFKINLTDILIKVLASAVAGNPEVNAYIDGDTIIYRDEVNVGFAVALENGLVVPVIRKADQKGIVQINTAKRDLASRAREGKLGIDEMNGGSITLTNMGSYGEGIFFPIINAPELCIIGTGKITDKPVAVHGEIVIRPMMWVTLVFDHRAVDGVPAAKLLMKIKDLIETPGLIMC